MARNASFPGSLDGSRAAQLRHHLPTAKEHQRGAEQKPSAAFVSSQGQAAERDQAEGGQPAEQGEVHALQAFG